MNQLQSQSKVKLKESSIRARPASQSFSTPLNTPPTLTIHNPAFSLAIAHHHGTILRGNTPPHRQSTPAEHDVRTALEPALARHLDQHRAATALNRAVRPMPVRHPGFCVANLTHRASAAPPRSYSARATNKEQPPPPSE